MPSRLGSCVLLAALAAPLCLLAAGRPVQAEETVRNPGSFVYAVAGDVDSLDPHWQFDGVSNMVAAQMYETLVTYKGSSVKEFEPLLATAVPSRKNGLVSPDGLVYTFPIRKGVVFQDGAPMTPEDVKYSLMRFLLLDRAGGDSSLLLEPILGVETTRDKDGRPIEILYDETDKAIRIKGDAVVVRLKKPFTPLLSVMAEWSLVVSKPWTIAHGGWDGRKETWTTRLNNIAKESSYLNDHVNGTGPFGLELWNKREKQLILGRNERYWRKPAALKTVIVKTVDEFSGRKLLLQTGDADAIFLERQFLPQLAGLEGVAVDDDLPFMEVHDAFIFNFKINPVANPYIGSGRLDGDGIPADFFADPDVRRAFAEAFDYDAYIRDGYRGKGARARGPIVPALFGYNPKQALTPYSLEKAAADFKKASGGRVWEKGFRVVLTYQEGWADRRLACEILKRGIESINPKFKIDIRGVQWSTLLAAWTAGRIPLTNARWGLDYADPHNCVHPFLHSEGYYAKLFGYNNPRADRLVEAAVRELDPVKRRAMYFELQKIAHDDLPAIFTIDTFYARARRSWIHDWTYNPIRASQYGYLYPVLKGDH